MSAIPSYLESFVIPTCMYSGDPGCLGWPEADHDEPCEYFDGEYLRCTECGGDNVYSSDVHGGDGVDHHLECSHFVHDVSVEG